jgi:Cytochrome P450
MRISTGALAPGPRGRLLRGSLAEFASDRLAFYTRLARAYGDVASFRLGPRRCLLISHPGLIEQVLVTESRKFTKHFAIRMDRLLLGNGLLTDQPRRARNLTPYPHLPAAAVPASQPVLKAA